MGEKIKNWLGRHKKAVVAAVILIALLAAIRLFFGSATPVNASGYQFVRTTTLQKTTLSDTVTVNGTVKSGQVASVTVQDSAKTYKVSTVNVAVGDTVRKGDVIATLDTSDLLKEIETAQQDYNDTLAQAQKEYDRALDTYNVELVRHQNNLIDLQEKIDKAEENLSEITENYQNTDPVYKAAADNYQRVEYYYHLYKDQIAEKQAQVTAKTTEAQNAEANWNANGKPMEGEAYNWYTGSREALATAQAELSALQSACSAPELGLYSWEEIVRAYESVDQLLDQVENAHDAYDDEKNYPQLKSAAQSLEDAQDRLEQAQRTPDTLENLQNTLDACTLTATMDGTVTALNATVGSACAGEVATIQDTGYLTVEVTIPPNQIPHVAVGMACRITSDATGQAEITGTLARIDPVANEQGSFGATVNVTGAPENLLIGIQAQVEIIISEKENVFCVPIDAVGTAQDGSRYVLRRTGGEGVNMTFEEVPVTTGDANDFYTEIDGDLAEGDVIRASANLTEGIENGAPAPEAGPGEMIVVSDGRGGPAGGGPR